MISSSDVAQIHRDLAVTRQNDRPVILRFPTETDCPTCGWDEFSQAAYDSQCPTCQGKGKILTWTEKRSRPRIQWVVETLFSQLASGGIEPGDCMLFFHERERYLYDEVMNTKDAYIEVDEVAVHPKSFNNLAVGQKVEVSIHCQRIKR